jgi:hypothetical protein
MSVYVRLGHVRLCCAMLGQIRSGYSRLEQVRSCYSMFHSYYIKLINVKSC